MKHFIFLIIIILLASCTTPNESSVVSTAIPISNSQLTDTSKLNLDVLQLPEGFSISLYGRAENARSMAISDKGTLFIGTKGDDKVYAMRDENNDGIADKLLIIASNMRMPNGVAFKDGELYVAEVSKLWKFPNIDDNLEAPVKELIYDDYPEDGHHGWKYIAFGPDDKLYVPVGAPCNFCLSKDEKYASITRMDANGANREIFAKGVRNTVGFTWHPETDEFYFTDNGRDMLSDDLPPCELNRATTSGQHFGFPFCHAGDILDPEFGTDKSCADYIAPVQKLGPHVAPLGLKFCTSDMFPSKYKNVAFIAEHGSWNRSSEAGHTGYKITNVKLENGDGVEYSDFISGFLDKATNKAWGRPVDVLFLEDGSMLISDDMAGAIYRVTYQK